MYGKGLYSLTSVKENIVEKDALSMTECFKGFTTCIEIDMNNRKCDCTPYRIRNYPTKVSFCWIIYHSIGKLLQEFMCRSKYEMECFEKYAEKPICQNKCEGINANIIKQEITLGIEGLMPDVINMLPRYENYKRGNITDPDSAKSKFFGRIM